MFPVSKAMFIRSQYTTSDNSIYCDFIGYVYKWLHVYIICHIENECNNSVFVVVRLFVLLNLQFDNRCQKLKVYKFITIFYVFEEVQNDYFSLNMTRSHVKYQIAKDADDTSDYFLQPVQEFSNLSKKEVPLWKKTFQITILIFSYFVLSVGLTFYVKWLYNTYGFKFPLVVVICHLLVKFLLATLIRCIKTCWKKQQLNLPLQSIIRMVVPLGIASGLDVGLSNWAISLIIMSLYTMTKSTTIIFILGFALFFKLEKKSWSLICIVVMISGGLFMFTYKSTQFEIFGFIICLLASFSSGIRWTMTQLIMQKSKLGMKSPIDMMYYMQLWMLLPIVPIMMWFEGPHLYSNFKNIDWNDVESITMTTTAVFGSAIIAFHMEVAEFLVVTYTSSLTLSIIGIIKEICILILAVEWKGDQMSDLNFIGLLMCLGGIIVHTVQKVLSSRNKIAENLELQVNSLSSSNLKNEEGIDTNLPLLTQKSTSLTNLLNAEFSSDEDDTVKHGENSTQILSNILQRREQQSVDF